jgi:hypothetical protein
MAFKRGPMDLLFCGDFLKDEEVDFLGGDAQVYERDATEM